jgi:hypothetical protein
MAASGMGWSKWAEEKGLRVIGVEHVEARPIVGEQAIWNDLNDKVLQSPEVICGLRNALTSESIEAKALRQ